MLKFLKFFKISYTDDDIKSGFSSRWAGISVGFVFLLISTYLHLRFKYILMDFVDMLLITGTFKVAVGIAGILLSERYLKGKEKETYLKKTSLRLLWGFYYIVATVVFLLGSWAIFSCYIEIESVGYNMLVSGISGIFVMPECYALLVLTRSILKV